MSKFCLSFFFLLTSLHIRAQMSEGVIEYEKKITTKKIIAFNGEIKTLNAPINLKTKSVLKFNSKVYSYKPSVEQNEDTLLESDGIKRFILEKMGEYDQYYFVLNKREGYKVVGTFYDIYTINNFFIPYTYTVTNDTKKILGYSCKKATLNITTKNALEKIIIWFTTQLPKNMGPEGFRGLEGTILEVNIDNNISLTATSVKASKNQRIIKPNYGTLMTYSAYKKRKQKTKTIKTKK